MVSTEYYNTQKENEKISNLPVSIKEALNLNSPILYSSHSSREWLNK